MAEYTFTFSCPGCCGSGGWEAQCRSRVGVATICGDPEFVTPTIPPKAYKKRNFGGTNTFENNSAGECTVKVCGGTVSIGGSMDYLGPCGTPPVNNSTMSSDVPECAGLTKLENGSASYAAAQCLSVCASGTDFITTTTRIRREFHYAPGGICINSPGDVTFEQLADEHTEEDAMEEAGAEWSEWAQGGCCTSKQPRGPGEFSFAFVDAEYRIRVKGAPGEPINLVLTFTRSDGDPFTETRQFVAQGNDFLDDWQSFSIVAPAGGWTCLASITRYIP